MKVKEGLAMHVHHNILFEYCYDYKERTDAIKHNKPAGEQEIRLRLFKMLSKEAIEELPEKLLKAVADRDKAYADLNKAYADLYKAYADLYKAYADRDSKSWHKKYCGCKEWDGKRNNI